MQRTMMKGKIHRARITEANLHYEGSITLDADLMDAADILEYEQVQVLDIDNGARLTTYAIAGPRGSGVCCINGAAAHLIGKGDLVIILAYASVEDAEAREFLPKIAYVNEYNEIVETSIGTRAFVAMPV